MFAKILDASTVANGATYTSPGIVIHKNHGAFALYYSFAGASASLDFFYYASADGENFVKKSYTIKRAAAAGSDIGVFAPQASEAIKIEVINTGSGSATAVDVTLVTRDGLFGELSGLSLDGNTKALQTIDYPHHEIHSGSSFTITDYDSDVDIAGPKYYRITTPDTKSWAHLTLEASAATAGLIELYENPTESEPVVAGTAFTAYNRDRNSSSTASLVIKYDPTFTSAGTRIWHSRIGVSGNPSVRSGGTSSSRDEFILKQNEDYVIKFTSDADNNALWIIFNWYEHTNR
jgi:hypothetical protein